MKYEFGVGSTKYSLEAKNDDIAFVSIVMYFECSSLPIALYEPRKKILNRNIIVDMDDFGLFVEENRDDLIKTRNSIKQLV